MIAPFSPPPDASQVPDQFNSNSAGDRLDRALEDHDSLAERSIAFWQTAICAFVLVLHLLAKLQSGFHAVNEWVVASLTMLIASSGLRFFLASKNCLRPMGSDALNVIDVSIFLYLVWTYQYAYALPAGSVLKAPSIMLLFAIVALRALKFHPRSILVTGITAVLGIGMVYGAAVNHDGLSAFTHDYREYLSSFKILTGAVIEKIVALCALTIVLAIAASKARTILTKAVVAADMATDYSTALFESEQRFKGIAEISSDWIWECDEEFRYTYLSERFSEITGLQREQYLGKTRGDFVQNAEEDWDAHLADLEARRPYRDFLCKMKNDAGEVRYWSSSGRPIFNEAGEFQGYRGTGTDRTSEVEAKAELIRHRDHLQSLVDEATEELKLHAEGLGQALDREKQLNDMQRQFVSMASHEFRTPLSIIDSAAQRLIRNSNKRSFREEDGIEKLKKIRGAVTRLTRLVDSTLNAAQLDEGKIKIEIEACPIAEAIANVCERHRDLAKINNIACDVSDAPKIICADTNAVDQILTNLVSNAVKYSPDASEISVIARTEGEFVSISVRDQGIGIDQDEVERVGERFFRARSSAGIVGTGIGLNLVKTLVDMHGGSLHVQSALGEGSTMTVRLPIAGPVPEEVASTKTDLQTQTVRQSHAG